jgi:hypothetical protein
MGASFAGAFDFFAGARFGVAFARIGDFAAFLTAFRAVELTPALRRAFDTALRRTATLRAERRLAAFLATFLTVFRARAVFLAALLFPAALRAAVRGVLDLAMSRPFSGRRIDRPTLSIVSSIAYPNSEPVRKPSAEASGRELVLEHWAR